MNNEAMSEKENAWKLYVTNYKLLNAIFSRLDKPSPKAFYSGWDACAKVKQEEIHRLKDLVKRAKPWAEVYKYEGSFLGMEQWLKDSEVIGE